MAKTVAELTLSLVKRNGRLGGYSADEEESLKESVLAVLKKVGVPEKEFPGLLKEWHKFSEFDYAHFILGGGMIPDNVDPSTLTECKALRDGGITHIPTPEDIRAFLKKHDLGNSDLDERLKDYEYYRSNRIHRRPEDWRNRTKWGQLKKA